MSRGGWTTVRVRTRAPDDVAAALFERGAAAIQDEAGAIVTHLQDADERLIRDAVSRADAGAAIEFAPTPDVDWSAAWRAGIRAHRIGSLVVTPPWLASDHDESTRIVIEPAMAFGTGEHETTRGILKLMQDVVRQGDVVVDLGAGSGVLAIAAAKLGALRAVAIELDPDAIGNATQNVAANGVADRVTVLEGDAATMLALVAPVRVIVANIVSSVLIQLLDPMARALAPDGRVILSGILVDEESMMVGEVTSRGWRVENSVSEAAWWSATIARH